MLGVPGRFNTSFTNRQMNKNFNLNSSKTPGIFATYFILKNCVLNIYFLEQNLFSAFKNKKLDEMSFCSSGRFQNTFSKLSSSTYSNDFNNSISSKLKKPLTIKNFSSSFTRQMSVLQTSGLIDNSVNSDSDKKFVGDLNLNSSIKSLSNTSNMTNEPALCYGKMKSMFLIKII